MPQFQLRQQRSIHEKTTTFNWQLIKARAERTRKKIKKEKEREREREKEENGGVGTRWHDLEGRGRVQARLKLPLCLTDLETARFAIAWLHWPHTTNASSARNTKNCPPRSGITFVPYVDVCKWNFAVFGTSFTRNCSNRCPTFTEFSPFFFFFLFFFVFCGMLFASQCAVD